MKLNREHISYSGNTASRSRKFQIADASLIADHMSNMYNNPIRAVVREYCCNALDGMVAAGRGDEPFTVIAPTTLHPYFEVIDTGTGMTEDEVYDLWGSYGASSKRDSNTHIGGFGIGSKSGFAYTKDYQITSIKDGVQTLYVNFWGTDGPEIDPLTTTKTDKPNGISIKIGVKLSDISKFQHEIKDVLKWFNPLPKVVNAEIEPIQYIKEGAGYAFLHDVGLSSSSWSNSRGIFAKIGPVLYPIKGLRTPFSADLILDIPNGAVKIAPNRESLIESESTLELLQDRLDTIFDYEQEIASQAIRNQPTLYSAIKQFKSCTSQIIPNIRFKWRHHKPITTFSYNQKQSRYERAYGFNYHNYNTVKLPKKIKTVAYKFYRSNSLKTNEVESVNVDQIAALFDTEGKKSNYLKKIRKWMENEDMSSFNGVIVLLKGTPKENLRTWLKLGRPEAPYFKYSDIDTGNVKTANTYKPVELKKVSVFSTYANVYDNHTVDFNSKDATTYLKIESNLYRRDNIYDQILFKYLKLGGITHDLVLVPKTLWNQIPDHWVDLNPAIEKAIREFNEIKPALKKDRYFSGLKAAVKRVLGGLPEVGIELPRSIKKILDYEIQYPDFKPSDYPYSLVYDLQLPTVIRMYNEKQYTFVKNAVDSKVQAKYPMLRLLSQGCKEKPPVEVVNYIKLINSLGDKGLTNLP